MAYNYEIVIEQYTQSRDAYGAIDAGSWATFKTLWADVQDVTGGENLQSDMLIYSDTKSFMIRYQDGKDITTKMRISYDGRYFNILSKKHDERLRTTLIAVADDDQ